MRLFDGNPETAGARSHVHLAARSLECVVTELVAGPTQVGADAAHHVRIRTSDAAVVRAFAIPRT